jgi:hypothetical protein
LNTDPQIHWFSIINSLMIVLFLTGMVAMIMMRTLHADFNRYNAMDSVEEAEETGWKLVHGDVFRPPRFPMVFSILVGSGVQVLGMGIILISMHLLHLYCIYIILMLFYDSFCRLGIFIASKSWRFDDCYDHFICCDGVFIQIT